MKYLYLTNKWLLIVNLILFIIPTYGLLFLIVTGTIQILLAIVITSKISRLNNKGKLLFFGYAVFTSIVLTLTCITYGEKLYFNDTTFIVVMVVSILLAILHLRITHLLYKAEINETN